MKDQPITSRREALRTIPSVNEIADHPHLAPWRQRLTHRLVVRAARDVVEAHRAAITDGLATSLTVLELAERVAAHLAEDQSAPLGPVINATGIIIHTGLGRAPLAKDVVDVLAEVAAGYAPVELDMTTGERGKRSQIVRSLLCELTGAESATVVNNNAAALMIVLDTLARGREVIVSRGELIEIGGSFRLPDVMKAGGAELREVGTTNKTRLSDYERAINEHTALLMAVHTSNYRVVGFTESPSIRSLAELAHDHGVPLVHDTGSGALVSMSDAGLAGEPDARASIAAGADLVLFSGDKLLGGPQSGIITGRSALVERIEKNPMMRALRTDKLTLAALAATLQLHRDPERAAQVVPVHTMVRASIDSLRARARQVVDDVRSTGALDSIAVIDTLAFLGGGSNPAEAIPSVGVEVRPAGMSERELAARLRGGAPPIVSRTHDGAVILDLRTIFEHQDAALVRALRAACTD